MYTAWYKTMNGLFWHKVKNVVGDTCYYVDVEEWVKEDERGQPIFAKHRKYQPVRVLTLADNSRIELPMNNCLVKFSKERFFTLKEEAEEEAGQELRFRKRR